MPEIVYAAFALELPLIKPLTVPSTGLLPDVDEGLTGAISSYIISTASLALNASAFRFAP